MNLAKFLNNLFKYDGAIGGYISRREDKTHHFNG